MLFHSHFFFFVYLPGVVGSLALGCRLLPKASERHRWTLFVLTLASFLFYAYSGLKDLPLLGASILWNWLIGTGFRKKNSSFKNRYLLLVGVTVNLALLVNYKYLPVLTSANPQTLAQLPLAISFFTFQQIAYLVDRYRGKIPSSPFWVYVTFVSFFPHLIAGPIVRYQELVPQLQKKTLEGIRWSALQSGFILFFIGVLKKFWIADSFSEVVSHGFSLATWSHSLGWMDSWRIALSYTLQIYFDFSGYSTMAIGLAKIFGIHFPENFNSPYQATSLIDFWHRWHITLSKFLRDYVYIPLGGSRQGLARKYLFIGVTFLLGGIWHGAGWTFLIWGAMHGCGLIMNHLLRDLRPDGRVRFKFNRLMGQAGTFLFVVWTWVPFRAPDLGSAVRLWKGMLGLNGGFTHLHESPGYTTSLAYVIQNLNWPFYQAHLQGGYALLEWLWIGLILLVCLLAPTAEKAVEKTKLRWTHGLIFGVFLFYYIQTAWVGRMSEFIYFHF